MGDPESSCSAACEELEETTLEHQFAHCVPSDVQPSAGELACSVGDQFERLSLSDPQCSEEGMCGECGELVVEPLTLLLQTDSVEDAGFGRVTLRNTGTCGQPISWFRLEKNAETDIFLPTNVANGFLVPAGGSVDLDVVYLPKRDEPQEATLVLQPHELEVEGTRVHVVVEGRIAGE